MGCLRFTLLLTVLAILGVADPAHSAVPKRVVFASGDPVPVVSADAAWKSFGLPYLDGAGILTVHGKIIDSANPGGTEVCLMAPNGGAFQVVARAGDLAPVPQTGGPVTLSSLYPYGALGGRVLLNATLAGAGITVNNDRAVFVATPNGLQLVVRDGDLLPGMSEPVTSFHTVPRLDQGGGVTFNVGKFTSARYYTYRCELGATPQLVGISDAPSVTLGSQSGYAMLSAVFPDPVVGDVRSVRRLYADQSVVIAQADWPVPGMPGWEFGSYPIANSCNDSGKVLFTADAWNESLPTGLKSRRGLWLSDGENAAEFIAGYDDPIFGSHISSFTHNAVNAAGDVAFFAGTSLCLKRHGQPLQRVAFSGMPRSPLTADLYMGSVLQEGLQVSANGNLVFAAESGLWVFTSDNQLKPIARIGEQIQHGGVDCTITTVEILPSGAGGQDSRRRMLSDNGQIAFRVEFTRADDPTPHTAIMIATLPHNGDPGYAPVAQSDVVEIRSGPGVAIRISVLANDVIPTGDTITIHSVSNPTKGKATIEGDRVRYLPNSQFSEEDRFSYIIKDLDGNVSTADVIIRNPFLPLRGGYTMDVGTGTDSAGRLNVNLSTGGQLTGRFTLAGRTYLLRGQLDYDGTFTQVFPAPTGPLTVSLRVSKSGIEDPVLWGNVEVTPGIVLDIPGTTSYGMPTGITAQRVTMQLRSSATPGLRDPGYRSFGYAIGKLTNSGRITLAGRLLDNRPFSVGAAIRRDGTFAIIAAPYGRNRGSLRGNFTVGTPTAKYMHWISELDWSYAPTRSELDQPDLSFETTLDAGMATYAVVPGDSSLRFDNGWVAALDIAWESSTYREIVWFDEKDIPDFDLPNSTRSMLHINRTTGLVTGSFAPDLDKPDRRSYRGVVYFPRNEVTGLIPHGQDPGSFEMRPTLDW